MKTPVEVLDSAFGRTVQEEMKIQIGKNWNFRG